MRSLSLTRISPMPRMTVRPSAKAAVAARIGYSSIMEAARSSGTTIPFSVEQRAVTSPTSSPPAIRRFVMVRSAPMSSQVWNRPVRSGFSITPSTVTSDPGTTRAAASGKAAEDGSPGTATWVPFSVCPPGRRMRQPAPSSVTSSSAPKARSIRSVWSRLFSGSTTTVSPSAFSPASRMADLIWAEATLCTKVTPFSPPPCRVSGTRSSAAFQSKRAPISASGPVTRFIGRLRREASPSKVAVSS